MKEFGERIEKLRKKKGYSQQELGNMIGVSRTSVSNYESGTFVPTLDGLIKLCEVLQTSPDFLLIGIENNLSLSEEGESYRKKIEDLTKENSTLKRTIDLFIEKLDSYEKKKP